MLRTGTVFFVVKPLALQWKIFYGKGEETERNGKCAGSSAGK